MPGPIKTKRCCKCKEIKGVSEFYKSKAAKGGLNNACKTCSKAYKQSQKNKDATKRYSKTEKAKQSAIRYLQSEKGKETTRKYKNSEKFKLYAKQYRQSNKCKAIVKRYQQSKEGKDAAKRYRQSEKGMIANKQSRDRHPDRIRAKDAVNNAVKAGRKHPAKVFDCSCGQQAEQYHHHKGYARKHWLDVVPVCRICHGKLHRQFEKNL